MAVTYGFYDSVGGDRKYNAEEFSRLFDGIIVDGVFHSVGDVFKVKPGTGLQVIVGTGRAWFDGTWTYNDADLPISLESPDVLGRIDAVVIEVNRDILHRKNEIKIVRGAPSTNPSKPILSHTDILNQHALAYITVKHGVSSITEADIENVVGRSETPFVTGPLTTVDVEHLFSKWEGEFDTWFEHIQTELSGDVAGNLQVQIDKLETNKADRSDVGSLIISGKKYNVVIDDTLLTYYHDRGDVIYGTFSDFYPYVQDDIRSITTGRNSSTNVGRIIYRDIKGSDKKYIQIKYATSDGTASVDNDGWGIIFRKSLNDKLVVVDYLRDNNREAILNIDTSIHQADGYSKCYYGPFGAGNYGGYDTHARYWLVDNNILYYTRTRVSSDEYLYIVYEKYNINEKTELVSASLSKTIPGAYRVNDGDHVVYNDKMYVFTIYTMEYTGATKYLSLHVINMTTQEEIHVEHQIASTTASGGVSILYYDDNRCYYLFSGICYVLELDTYSTYVYDDVSFEIIASNSGYDSVAYIGHMNSDTIILSDLYDSDTSGTKRLYYYDVTEKSLEILSGYIGDSISEYRILSRAKQTIPFRYLVTRDYSSSNQYLFKVFDIHDRKFYNMTFNDIERAAKSYDSYGSISINRYLDEALVMVNGDNRIRVISLEQLDNSIGRRILYLKEAN